MTELKKIPYLLRKPNPNALVFLHFTSSYVSWINFYPNALFIYGHFVLASPLLPILQLYLSTCGIIIIIIIITHVPYFTSVQPVLKTVRISPTKHLLSTVQPNII
jgi:hypothetical protein